MRALLCVVLPLGLGLLGRHPVPAAPPPLTPPSPETLAEARRLVEEMAAAERGPYLRLRWWCRDGTVHPPTPYACAGRGGGRQHGEYSPARTRLAELGWPVGTVLAALPLEEAADPAGRHRRLQHLVLARYLVDHLDGWVMRRARTYRGHVQVEDEEAAGTRLLTHLLGDRGWASRNFLLARELTRTLPHAGGGEDRTREVRRLSQELAERDPSFEPLRVRIHTSPGPADLAETRAWLAAREGRREADATLDLARELVRTLEGLYGERRDAGLARARSLESHPAFSSWVRALRRAASLRGLARIAALATALREGRVLIERTADGAASLAAMDVGLEVERELSLLARAEAAAGPRPRREALALAGWLAVGAEGAGLLSSREAESALAGVLELRGQELVPLEEMQRALRRLRRLPGWALGNVRHAFAEALVAYGALEPRSLRFLDEALRGSPMLPLADLLAALVRDMDARTGRVHRIFGEPVGGVLALNPGVAVGPLRELDLSPGAPPPPREVVALLARTVTDLSPVAGILSQEEGNLLSHVQLLARNLGIPTPSLSSRAAARLRAALGEEVLVAVGAGGSVVIERASQVPAGVRARVLGAEPAGTPALLDAPLPDLRRRAPLGLAALHAGLSGRVVGPKAANLGELARRFPGKVSGALALPFGFFDAYTAGGPASVRARLERAYAARRAGELSDAALAAELADLRAAIARTRIDDADRERLGALFDRHLGGRDAGVFVRSDTNVEDLPGFTGAGLNETRPNVVGLDAVLEAIPGVWSSVLSPRALAWRGSMLRRPERVYSSVLLQASVAAEKSGVLVTRDLVEGGPGLTVSTAWGVGGAVDGEEAETLVLRPEGEVVLVAEAAAPYQRTLRAEGGVEWAPAPAGRVLEDAEVARLRALAREVEASRPPARDEEGRALPWDVEFGFRGGELALFQIRPLVQRGGDLAEAVVQALAPPLTGPIGVVSLDEAIELRGEEVEP